MKVTFSVTRTELLIISASLSIRIASMQSANVTEHSSVPSVCPVSCGKTADWIRMPFGVVSGVGLGMGVFNFGGDRRTLRTCIEVSDGIVCCRVVDVVVVVSLQGTCHVSETNNNSHHVVARHPRSHAAGSN